MSEAQAVYIVDDDPMVRHSTAFFLSAASFEPRLYANGRAFLKDAPTLAPGCVLLDVRMVNLGGLEVIELLGNDMTRLPVVIMTGHGDVETAVKAMKLGATDFLEKPFAEDTLIEILNRTFDRLAVQMQEFQERTKARQLVDRLTPRETDVLRGLIGGRSNKILAFELGLSTRTVEMHRARMMERLGAKSLSEALKTALAAGLTDL